MMPWRVANSVCTLSQKVTAPGSAMRWAGVPGSSTTLTRIWAAATDVSLLPLLAGELGLLELHGG